MILTLCLIYLERKGVSTKRVDESKTPRSPRKPKSPSRRRSKSPGRARSKSPGRGRSRSPVKPEPVMVVPVMEENVIAVSIMEVPVMVLPVMPEFASIPSTPKSPSHAISRGMSKSTPRRRTSTVKIIAPNTAPAALGSFSQQINDVGQTSLPEEKHDDATNNYEEEIIMNTMNDVEKTPDVKPVSRKIMTTPLIDEVLEEQEDAIATLIEQTGSFSY